MNRQLLIIVTVWGLFGALVCVASFGAAIFLCLYLDAEGLPTGGSSEGRREVILPNSVLAEPADAETSTHSISITVAEGDRITVDDREGSITDLASLLREELEELGEASAVDCRVFIYAKPDLSADPVQRVIGICQDMGFESFRLRVIDE